MTRQPLSLATCVTLALLATTAATSAAPESLAFQTHAAFFSTETQQAKPLDPQVFVRSADAKAGAGPQGIQHAAGFRPAFIKDDTASTPLFNAQGQPLGFTLGDWLAATGEVTLTPVAAGGATVHAVFHHLRPDAEYSLFENHFDQTPIGFTPLDGAGMANSFRTDAHGDGTLTVTAPQPITHDNAVLAVYHADGQAHGTSRGNLGVTALHHIIVRPAAGSVG